MTIKIGINGFGRMGRLSMRAAYDWEDIDIVQINDPAGNAETLAHLMTFDSVHGKWHHDATHTKNAHNQNVMIVNGTDRSICIIIMHIIVCTINIINMNCINAACRITSISSIINKFNIMNNYDNISQAIFAFSIHLRAVRAYPATVPAGQYDVQ